MSFALLAAVSTLDPASRDWEAASSSRLRARNRLEPASVRRWVQTYPTKAVRGSRPPKHP